ncbi:hypothetical protein NE237_005160 [Protea cynaroides]|uniref:Uncharacterized protein n=1 Tax=Protea cynaroides TaxID=273540 RepID=A0A9Q0KKT9_9MAGN|nr:hypothetical protein NE237_005160 [Protea cynaroides]
MVLIGIRRNTGRVISIIATGIRVNHRNPEKTGAPIQVQKRKAWDALRKIINGDENKVDATNIKKGVLLPVMYEDAEGIPGFTDAFATSVVGDLLLKRIVLLKKAYKRNYKMELCIMLLKCQDSIFA